MIVASRAGRVIRAIRDAESRTRFLGYRVESFKLWVFVFSAVLAGIAGALYVPQIGIINPSEFSPINSIEVVIWVAVGGRGTLYGAAAGAVLVNYAKTYFTSTIPEAWYYALGTLFVLVTLFLPRGIIGLVSGRARKQQNGARVPLCQPIVRSHPENERRGKTLASRQADRQLRWFQGAQRTHAADRARRTALHHRTKRRGQDHHDGRHYRQDSSGFRNGAVWRRS